MPDVAAAHRASQQAKAPRARLDVLFAGGISLVALAGLVVYPHASADETRISAESPGRRAEVSTNVVTIPTLSAVRESVITAPPLTMPYVPKAGSPEAKPNPRAPRAVPAPAPVAAVVTPTQVVAEVPAVDAPSNPAPETPSPPPAPTVDPMQRLRNAIGACARLGGVLERAVCEQGARLAHCDGYWGAIGQCPTGRTDYGQ